MELTASPRRTEKGEHWYKNPLSPCSFMGNVRDLRDQSMFALRRLLDAEGIDLRIEVYLLL